MARILEWGKDLGCLNCQNFNLKKWGTCKAFLKKIPHQIVSGQHDHRNRYRNQPNDILYKQVKE